MNKIILLISLLISSIANAQTIPNANFENWITDTLGRLDPDNWECSNLSTDSTSVFQDVGRNGTGFSVKFVVVPTGGLIPEGGNIGLSGVPFTGPSRPTSLKGYWKCNNTNGDWVSVHLYVYDSLGGYITDSHITTPLFNSIGWTAFTAPLTYTSGVSVGSYTLNISLFAHGSASMASTGHVDDLQFDFNTGIDDLSNSFSNCYLTNNGSTYNLNFISVSSSDIRASILDVTGREVLVIANEKYSPGTHSVSFDTSQLAPGIYSCLVTDGDSKNVVKMRVE